MISQVFLWLITLHWFPKILLLTIPGGTDENQIQDHLPEIIIILMIHGSQNTLRHIGQI